MSVPKYDFVCLRYFLRQIILDAGVDVNIRNAQNTTPLHVALNRGANSCVGLLLAAGANCNLQVQRLSIFQYLKRYFDKPRS
jgi:ankyrin repeat protein